MTDQKMKDAPDVIKFLLGEGTLDGLSFGEFPDNGEKYKRRYWWRRALREAWNTRAPQPQSGDRAKALECLVEMYAVLNDSDRFHPHMKTIRAALTQPEFEVVDVKDQNMAVWKAMGNIKIGNKTDDKMIVAELHKMGYQIVRKKGGA